jgi:CheY-like chemotaxis protein
LVVDDEEAVLRVIKRVLDDGEVVCKARAMEALELIQGGQSFDAILCDLMMPQMSGIELYEHLLATRPEQAGRMIFMTGGALTAQASDFLRSVPNSKIEKPFQVSVLREAVQRFIEHAKASRPV